MSNLNDIRNYNSSYKGYDVSLEVINETHTVIDNDPFKISVVDAYIEKKGKSKMYLGSFFVHLPRVLEESDEKKLISFLVNNIDSIICDRYRYIGNFTNDNVSDEEAIIVLKETFPKPLEEELKNIYLEFLSIDKNKEPKRHRNYASFLEFYFYGQEHIPDSIKIEYMKRNQDKSLINYNDIDLEIRSQFSGNTYESHKRLKDELRNEIRAIDAKDKEINKEIYYIEDFIRSCEFLSTVSDNHDTIEQDIKRLETKIARIKIDLIKKIKLKKELKPKKSDSRMLSKTEIEGTMSLKEDIIRRFPNLEGKIEKLTIWSLFNLLCGMLEEKIELLKQNSNTRSSIQLKISEYEEDDLDFDYFFERISQISNVLENRKGSK